MLNGGIPSKFGGLGLGVLDECILSEELAYACTGIMTAIAANGLAVSGVIMVPAFKSLFSPLPPPPPPPLIDGTFACGRK